MHLKLYKRDWGLAWCVQGSGLVAQYHRDSHTSTGWAISINMIVTLESSKGHRVPFPHISTSHPPVCAEYLAVSVIFFIGHSQSPVKEADSNMGKKGKSGWPGSSVILQNQDAVKIPGLQQRQRSQLKKK